MKYYLTCALLFILSYVTVAQTELTGTVNDGNGNPVDGALIQIKGTAVSSISDVTGKFTLPIETGYETIIISGDGFETQTVLLTGENTLTVSLKPQQSSNVVNVGFGNQSKDEITSSVSSIGSNDFIEAPLPNLEQANQGTTPGLFVQNTSGTLGEDTQVRIRGGSSLTGSNEPLYVVDGVPLVSGSQSNISSSNIASIEVLKDASATAIYGTRAANGVVLITTKGGNTGKLKVNLDYQFGVSEKPKSLDLIDGDEHRRTVFEFTVLGEIQQISQGAGAPLEILVNGVPTNFGREFIEDNYTNIDAISYRDPSGRVNDGNPVTPGRNRFLDSLVYNTNWQEEVFRTGYSHKMNVDFQGGKDVLNYFVSLGYNTQEGILIGNNFDRFNATTSFKSSITDKLSAGLDFNFINVKDERLKDNLDLGNPMQAIVLPPSDTYDPNNFDSLLVFGGRNFYNPITEINYSDFFTYEDSYIASLSLKYKINDQFSFDVNGGIDFADITTELEQQEVTLSGTPNGLTIVDEQEVRNYVFNAWGTYNKFYPSGNALSVILGTSYQDSKSEFSSKQAFVPTLEELNGLNENDDRFISNPIPGSANSLVSSYARASYSIKNKYDLQFSGRVDGSSRFSEDNRYGFFPAISAGWNLHNESFYDSENTLKLRASYGIVGNTPFDDFAYRRNFITVQLDSLETIEAVNVANDDLKWESTSQLNIGLDFGFFDSRLTGSLDYYIKETTDLLFPRPISLTTGFPTVLDNIGTMENIGFEVFISSINLDKGNFTWSTDFNIATNENTINDLGGQQAVVGVSAYLEGQPAGVFYTREYVGVDPATGNALYNDGMGGKTDDYDSAPLLVVGDPNPDFFGGLNNTITYKNFELSFLFQFVQGNDIYFATGEQLANSGINLQGQLNTQVDRWYAPGDIAANPGLDIDGNPALPSSRWIEDGSYIRLKNIMLTFNFPNSLLSNLGFETASFYVGATNILTLTDYIGYDPDVNYVDPFDGQIGQNISRGIDNFSTPQPRIIMTGIKIGL